MGHLISYDKQLNMYLGECTIEIGDEKREFDNLFINGMCIDYFVKMQDSWENMCL